MSGTDPGRLTAERIIERLGLIAHPEGGFFRETYRSGAEPMASQGATDRAGSLMSTGRAPDERNVMTSIYWMPTREASIAWLCENASDHVHYYQLGSAITYYVVYPDGELKVHRLGPDVEAGDVLQLVVPGAAFKAAELREGEFGLIGEAVAPGFDFSDFRWVSRSELDGSPHEAALARFIRPDARRDFGRYYE